MKSNQEMVRRIEKFSVTQRTSDGFFDGSELLRQWNSVEGNQQRKMARFLEMDTTKEFLTALAIDEYERKAMVQKCTMVIINKLQISFKIQIKNS